MYVSLYSLDLRARRSSSELIAHVACDFLSVMTCV
jgi:hypothetical protein